MEMIFLVVLNRPSFADQMRRWVRNGLKILFCALLAKITANEFGKSTTDIRIMWTEPFTSKEPAKLRFNSRYKALFLLSRLTSLVLLVTQRKTQNFGEARHGGVQKNTSPTFQA
ncbi:hypothetical protein PIB30_011452 [Stylosanthes scabra]|uniref:Uncharacterized protein n=1 Tax=Stylosanthes scabra TaxID=79078 RepID=A0ABU6R4Q5_9FABA|nr:hypothetical protein [Stylosanthes scabra]